MEGNPSRFMWAKAADSLSMIEREMNDTIEAVVASGRKPRDSENPLMAINIPISYQP
jgi:hypothetical protein